MNKRPPTNPEAFPQHGPGFLWSVGTILYCTWLVSVSLTARVIDMVTQPFRR